MAEGKGGVFGSFVMIAMPGGTSQVYGKKKKSGTQQKALPPAGGVPAGGGEQSPKSNLVMIKEPIAKFFGFQISVPMDVVKSSLKKVETTINAQKVTRTTMVNMGATGASRSLTIKFKKLENIGGKKVASVKMALPSSHTFGDMVQVLMTRTNASSIAAIVSPSGRTMSFQTAYNPKNVKNKGGNK